MRGTRQRERGTLSHIFYVGVLCGISFGKMSLLAETNLKAHLLLSVTWGSGNGCQKVKRVFVYFIEH